MQGSTLIFLDEKQLVRMCYDAIPRQLAKELKKFQYSTVEKGQTRRKFEGSIKWLKDSSLVNACYNVSEPQIPLMANARGGVYENIISECLVKRGYKLYYYKPDESREIEFLIEKNGEVVPIEVKAGNNVSVSLNRFIDDFSPSVAYKFIANRNGKVGIKETMPHYMIMFM